MHAHVCVYVNGLSLQLQHSRTLDSVLVSFFGGSPVDNLPDTIDVGCFVVEVLTLLAFPIPSQVKKRETTNLQIIRMLPHINPKNRRLPRNRILILGRHNLQLPLWRRRNQPSPTTPLNPQQRTGERLLKTLNTTPLPLNRGLQTGSRGRDLRLRGAGGGQVLPEEGVVDVATAVELDFLLQGDELRHVLGLEGGGLGG